MKHGTLLQLGLFGGSFDPIHRGHVEPVLAARRRLGLDRVVYLPTARPPHKSPEELAPALARFTMVELALLDHPELEVDAFEMGPDAPSYAVDTVRHFRERFPQARLHYLIGADSLAGLPRWRRAAELLDQVELIVLARPGWDLERAVEAIEPAERDLLSSCRIQHVDNPQLAISSTRLRQALVTGTADSEHALHPQVLRYVAKYGLYRTRDA